MNSFRGAANMTPSAFGTRGRLKSAFAAIRLLCGRVAAGVRRLIEPVSRDEDDRRKEYILNVILTLSIIFLLALLSIIIINKIRFGEDYDGMAPEIFTAIILAYAGLFVLSKKGLHKIAAYSMICFYLAGAVYSGWMWGESLPATLLANTLIVVTASILINSRFGLIMAACVIVLMAALGAHEWTTMGVPDWHDQEISMADIVGYAIMIMYMGFISWLSNREIDKSLARARISEKALAHERDTLERRVSERTSALLAAEKERVTELERVAQFGSLSQGLFHDLMNPLSSMALYIENIKYDPRDAKETRDMVKKTVEASKRMRSFMDSVRKCLRSGKDEHSGSTDIRQEISIVKDILAYKARMEGINMVVGRCDAVNIPIHPVRVHQVLLNLMTNAVEACVPAGKDSRPGNKNEKTVSVSVSKSADQIRVEITDNGCGMPKTLLDKALKERFTTKEKGTGIGLMTAKSIVEKEFYGSIMIESEENIGTKCVVVIPIKNYENEQRHSKEDRRTDSSP